MKVAICPGSFDPVTNGHVDIISRAAKIFDKVIVVVMINSNKSNAYFTAAERVELIKRSIPDIENAEVEMYGGLLAEYAEEKGACAVVKGLRAVSDFEYEFQQALTNKRLNPDFETVFMTTDAENMFLSSSVVKQVCEFGGDISGFVPPQIHDDIVKRISERKRN
jgi:pantetheine-phosphate adenylyltransferase